MNVINNAGPSNKKRRTCHEEVQIDKETINLNHESKSKTSQITNHKKIIPKFRLKATGDMASLNTTACERVPLMLTDIQYLLLHSLLGNLNLSEPARWYNLEKCGRISQTTCLIIEGVSIQHWHKLGNSQVFINKVFNQFVEILTPSAYSGSLVQELALVPLSEIDKEAIIQKYGSMNLALESRKDLMVMMKAVFPIKGETPITPDTNSEDVFPRTQLILSAWQLVEENYPVPLKGKLKDTYADYVMTKDEYRPVTSKSPMYGLDCEMCMTKAGLELAHISIVDEKHNTIYETLVKPYNEITDYLTRYSGITKSLLNNVTKRVEDVQKDLKQLLPPDAILVGQSLNSDLHALKMMHPYIIDTSLIYNFTGERTRKPKLKVLAKEFLDQDIQSGSKGHCPVEDSLASLKLVQLKLSKSMEYGDAVHTNRQKIAENITMKRPQYAMSIFNHMMKNRKSSIIVGCDDITGDYHTYFFQAKETFSLQFKKNRTKRFKLATVDEVEDVISTLVESVHDYNFAMAHLKLQIDDNNETKQLQHIDKWIETIWKSLEQLSLFVVVFGGTCSENGMAMINIKNT